MPGGLTLPMLAAFTTTVAVLVGLAIAVLSLTLKAQNAHRKRLSRVGRQRMSGRLDFEDSRLSLAKGGESKTGLMALSEALAKVFPLLDTADLRAKIVRSGLKLSLSGFVTLSLVAGVALAKLASLVTGVPVLALIAPGAFAGMALMNAFVAFRGEVMSNRFMKQMPDAIDTIIRGIRSGLPVVECVAAAGQEMPAPLGPHFQSVGERVQLGETLDSALWRVARVIDRPEMDFFAISISIQAETGGSLADALGNLADLLRKREHLKLKIKAISSEAKASAMIIGALPFVMLGLLTFMSPAYVMPLFTDPRGQMMLGAGLGSIMAGAFVMWRMTKFEI